MMHLLILMPELFHGGAETQFRRLFENMDNCYIAALNISYSDNAISFKRKYADRIWEIKNPCSIRIFFQLFTYLNIIISILYFRIKLRGAITLIVYGAGTRWLVLYPFFRLLRYKILYSERNDGYHKFKFLYKIMEKCDVLTTNSIEASSVISKYVKKEIHVINNGIIVPTIRQENFRFHSPLKILIPARVHRLKNQKIVIEALCDMKNVEIHFAGSIDDENYFNMLINMISEKNAVEKFSFDGYVEDVVDSYKNYDLILLPSFSEGTPNVLLEAMANMVPCMASNISMNRRLFDDERFLFNPNDSSSLFSCVNAFINMTFSDIEYIVSRNYEFVKRNYSLNTMITSFRRLLNSI